MKTLKTLILIKIRNECLSISNIGVPSAALLLSLHDRQQQIIGLINDSISWLRADDAKLDLLLVPLQQAHFLQRSYVDQGVA